MCFSHRQPVLPPRLLYFSTGKPINTGKGVLSEANSHYIKYLMSLSDGGRRRGEGVKILKFRLRKQPRCKVAFKLRKKFISVLKKSRGSRRLLFTLDGMYVC